MDTELRVIMERVQKIQEGVDRVTAQLDSDRKDIDLLRIEMASIKAQQQQIISNMDSFRGDIRDMLNSAVREYVGKYIRMYL